MRHISGRTVMIQPGSFAAKMTLWLVKRAEVWSNYRRAVIHASLLGHDRVIDIGNFSGNLGSTPRYAGRVWGKLLVVFLLRISNVTSTGSRQIRKSVAKLPIQALKYCNYCRKVIQTRWNGISKKNKRRQCVIESWWLAAIGTTIFPGH